MSRRQQALLAIFLGLASVGFLAPRFEIIGIRLALTDLACILIICVLASGPTKYSQYLSGFRRAELLYVCVYIILGLGYSIAFSDLGSLVISIRVFLFCLAGASVAFLSNVAIKQTLKTVTVILLVFYMSDAVHALSSLLSGKTSLFEFMWNYDAGRLTAPNEGSEGTSSVPIGYLFSFIFLFAISQYDKDRTAKWFLVSLIAIAMCVLTASRTSILSVMAVISIFGFYSNKKSKFIRQTGIMLMSCGAIYWLADILLSKSIIDESLDGSSLQRLGYYQTAIENLFSGPASFIFGNGISDSLLLNRTGTSFYESLLFNSMAQGGIILFVPSLMMLTSPFYSAYRIKQRIPPNQRRNLLSVGMIVLIGNMVGGANYFSLYAYLYFCLLYTALSDNRHYNSSVGIKIR